MKIEYKEILRYSEKAAIDRMNSELKLQGFKVSKYYRFDNIVVDLYAEKENDKRIYEFKASGYSIRKEKYLRLQQLAKSLDAKLYVTYVTLPILESSIEFDRLPSILLNDLINDFPNELDCLSTHTRIDDVSEITIESLKIEDFIYVIGSGIVTCSLQYCSDRENDGNDEYFSCSFDFNIQLDFEFNILNKKYVFNTEDFYN